MPSPAPFSLVVGSTGWEWAKYPGVFPGKDMLLRVSASVAAYVVASSIDLSTAPGKDQISVKLTQVLSLVAHMAGPARCRDGEHK